MHSLLEFKNELYRKLIHLSSSLISLAIWWFGKEAISPFLLFFTFIFILFDYSRRHIDFINLIYLKKFGIVTRHNEYNKLSGASWVFLGASIVVLLFSEIISIIKLFTFNRQQ